MPKDFNWNHTREDWEQPGYRISEHTNSPAFPWGTVDRIAIHYTAAVDVPDGDPDELPWEDHLPQYLQAIQRFYVHDRGYSIGYSSMVDQRGEAWQLRGVDWRAASNAGWNSRTFSILVMVDGDDPATDAAASKIREIVAWFRSQSPNKVQIVGHRDIGSTSCPGTGLYYQIINDHFEPNRKVTVSNLTFDKDRVLDTRKMGAPTAAKGQVITLSAPAGAKAVKVNVTAVGAAGSGFVTAYPAGTSKPVTSDLNYHDARAVCNQIDVQVNGGKYSLYVSHPTHIIVDQVGYWT